MHQESEFTTILTEIIANELDSAIEENEELNLI